MVKKRPVVQTWKMTGKDIYGLDIKSTVKPIKP